MKKPNVRTEQWPANAEKIIARSIGGAYDHVIFGNSRSGQYRTTHPISESFQFVISYNYSSETFIVWNAAIHRFIHRGKENTTLSTRGNALSALVRGIPKKEIKRVFQEFGNLGDEYKDCGEIVLLVGKEALCDFCNSPEEYIFPELDDIPKGKICLFARAGASLQRICSDDPQSITQLVREREQVSRAKRNSLFRQRAIEKWKGQCIICGAKELRILEAAHKESVFSGGNDAPDNSYCLCANHHIMYDHGFISINEDQGIFSCESATKEIKQMAWYKEAEKRQFRLYLERECQ